MINSQVIAWNANSLISLLGQLLLSAHVLHSPGTRSTSQRSSPSPMSRKFSASRSKTPGATTRTARVATTNRNGVIVRSTAIKGFTSTFCTQGETPHRILPRQCFPCCPPIAANRLVSTVLVIKPSSAPTKPAWQCCTCSRATSSSRLEATTFLPTRLSTPKDRWPQKSSRTCSAAASAAEGDQELELSPSFASSTRPTPPECFPVLSTVPVRKRARKYLAGSIHRRASPAC